MTNQQGAPEALRLADRLSSNTGHVGGPTMDAAAAELRRLHAENQRLAALVEAQQPAPSAAAAVNPYPHAELRKTWRPGQRWQARSFRNGQWGPWTDAVASEPFWFPHQDYRRHPDDLAPQPSPTPQADSQPAPADVEDAIAWLVTWKGGEHTYAHAHASELPAINQARIMGGTVTPCVAARAPEGSVTAPAGGVEVQPSCPGIPRPGCNYLAQCESVCNKCGKLHSARFLEDSQPVAAARRWSTYEQAIADPVFQTVRSIMGTENIGQDRQLVKAINHVIDSTPPAQAADSVLEDAALTFTSAHIDYVARYGGRCRDCADESGVCPGSGLPCADSRKAIKHVFDALEYGVKHGFIKSPVAARKQGANHD